MNRATADKDIYTRSGQRDLDVFAPRDNPPEARPRSLTLAHRGQDGSGHEHDIDAGHGAGAEYRGLLSDRRDRAIRCPFFLGRLGHFHACRVSRAAAVQLSPLKEVR